MYFRLHNTVGFMSFLLAVTTTLLSQPVIAQDTTDQDILSVEEILKRAVDAVGGEQAIKNIETMVITGEGSTIGSQTTNCPIAPCS